VAERKSLLAQHGSINIYISPYIVNSKLMACICLPQHKRGRFAHAITNMFPPIYVKKNDTNVSEVSGISNKNGASILNFQPRLLRTGLSLTQFRSSWPTSLLHGCLEWCIWDLLDTTSSPWYLFVYFLLFRHSKCLKIYVGCQLVATCSLQPNTSGAFCSYSQVLYTRYSHHHSPNKSLRKTDPPPKKFEP
jgi:hypothetical protein